MLVLVGTSANVLAQASQPNVSRPFAPGSCGPVDPTYIRTAEATGGIPFFFQRSEVAQATKFMMASSGENHVTVLWAKGTLQSSSRDFVVPIDSSLTKIVFVLSADNHATKMEVFDSGGTPLSTSRQSDTTDFTCGRYIATTDLPPANYRVHVTGTGRFWVSVQGKSEIFLHRVEFVEPGGRPGHEGLFPIHGQPIVGRRAHLRANISGPAKEVSFALISPESKQLNFVAMKRVEKDADDQEFDGILDLPIQPFRIVAVGRDEKGESFQRTLEAQFRPATIEIALLNAPDLIAGKTSILTYKVTNLGAGDNFRVVGVCAHWPAQASHSELSLRQGESANVKVPISVPTGTSSYTNVDIVLTATSTRDLDNSNGVVHSFEVRAEGK